MKRKRRILLFFQQEGPYLLVLLFFIFLSSRAIFHSGFFRTVDDITSVRIAGMVSELKRSTILDNVPVRWLGDLAYGYGYPLFFFYSPLVYYAGAFLVLFGNLSFIIATKCVYVFPLLAGPVLFYWAARQKLNRNAALTAALFYTLFPYRGYDTYTRGAVGEAWVMALLPGVFVGIFLYGKKSKGAGYIIAFFLCLVILSHNLASLLALVLLLLYGLCFNRRNKNYWKYHFLGLGMSAFYLIPCFYYLSAINISRGSSNTGQLLNYVSPVQDALFGPYPYNPERRFSSLFTYILLLGFFLLYKRYRGIGQHIRKEFLFWGIISTGIYALLFEPFLFFWKITLPLTQLLQYPWRILTLLSITLPFFAGYIFTTIRNQQIQIFLCIVAAVSLCLYLTAFRPKEYSYYYEYSAEATGSCATTTWDNEYLSKWTTTCVINPATAPVETNPISETNIIQTDPLRTVVNITAKQKTELTVNKYYFPGWTIIVDKQEVPLSYGYSPWGTFKTPITPGTHRVEAVYRKTSIMWLADIITIISWLVFVSYGIKRLFVKAAPPKI